MIKLVNKYKHHIGLKEVRENLYKVIMDSRSHYFRKGYDVMDLKVITFIEFEGGPRLEVGEHIEQIIEKVIGQTEDEDNIVEYYITFTRGVPEEIILKEE